ncbi:MAG: hypothetical protein LC733_09655 [Actinobacteria bacterium]|nr:hypothetical protein [Actinomycetota bacterium]
MGEHHHHPSQPPTDDGTPSATMGSHGMLVLGEETTFLSHLPMFMFDAENHPHNFQVILDVTFERPPGGDPPADYVGDRRQHPDMRLYTFIPAEFEMDRLDPAARSIEAITGEVHSGHFERHEDDGGRAIGVATARIGNVVHFRAFEKGANKPPELEYLLFGKSEEQFLAHLITAPPDFDHIVSVGATDGDVTPGELTDGITVRVPGRLNTPKDRLRPGERVSGRVVGGQSADGRDLELEVRGELYFEEGELGDPFTTRQTPEERKAGF